MPITVRIPLTLRRLCGGEELVEVHAGTVASALGELQARFNGVHERLMDERSEIRGSVLVFVNDEDIRFLQNRDTPLRDGDEMSIIPAFAGG